MKLVNSKYGLDIEFIENSVNVLVLENPMFMSDVIQDIISQENGMDGNFVLSNEQNIKFEKDVMLITDPFHIDFNNKKIMNKLYSQLVDISKDLVEEYNDINKTIVEVLEKISDGINYNCINYNLEFEWKELYKLYNVRIEERYESLEEKLVEYMKILSGIMEPKLVIFLNLKTYLGQEHMEDLVLSSFYNKVPLLLIESNEGYKLKNERKFIIDKDRCLIIK
jgi:CRISPR-associated protein Csn2